MQILDDNYEKPMSIYKLTTRFYRLGWLQRQLVTTFVSLTGNKRLTRLAKNLRKMNKEELEEFCFKREQLVLKMKEKFQSQGIEAVLCPGYVSQAFKAKYAGDLGALVDYSMIWNTVNFPCGIIPIT